MALPLYQKKVFAVVLLALSLVFLTFSLLPHMTEFAQAHPSEGSGACAHFLPGASQGSPLTIECFLNATAQLTFEPSAISVPGHARVVFTVGNIGGIPHTFTLDSLGNDTQLFSWEKNPKAVSFATLSSYFTNHTAVNLYLNGTGAVTSPTITLAKPYGIYGFVCMVPGHFQSGMFGSLYVGLTPPTPPPLIVVPPVTEPVAEASILGVVFVLIATTLVLTLSAWPLRAPRWARGAYERIRITLSGPGASDQNTLKSWIYTTDHKRIGILYLITALYFFFLAGSFAMLMRTQLLIPQNGVATADVYNQLVTMHGLIMALLFMSPFAFALANYVIPLEIGARDMAFPRLNALSYWLYFFGGTLLVSGLFLPGGGLSCGWTLYSPLCENQYTPQPGVDAGLAGLLLLAISVILSTANIATTVARHRAKGFSLMDMPMFVWSLLFTLAMMWLAFPDLSAAVTLLFLDRTIGSTVFLSPSGGALLWQQVFWFFGHPEVYILIFPAFGAMYDIASVFSGRPIYGKKYVLYSMAAIVVLSMMVWLHHMFMTGVNLGWIDLQSITTGAISIPSDTMVLGIMLTLVGGRIRAHAPMLFTLGAIPLFIIGGLTGVLISVPALDVNLHGTYWVVGHFHYMLAGTALWGLTAATYYWFPKMTGRMYSEKIARVHFVLAAIGVNVLYLSFLDLYDMPRRVYTYLAIFGFGEANFLATLGGYIYGTAQLVFLSNLIYSLKKGAPASANPWGAWSFEWLTSSPPPAYDFDGTPRVEGNRLVVDPPEGPLHAPRPSPWPFLIALWSALSLAGLLLYLTWGSFLLLGIGLLAFMVAVLGWAWEDYRGLVPSTDQGERQTWPFTGIRNVPLATLLFITGDLAFVGTLVGAYVFVGWQGPSFGGPLLSLNESQNIFFTLLSLALLLFSILSAYFALEFSRHGHRSQAELGIATTLVLGATFLLFSLANWQVMATNGLGLSTISTNITTSMFYDFSIIHFVHLVAMMGVLGYFAIRLQKLPFASGPPGLRDGTEDSGTSLDGLTAAVYLWIFVAIFGMVILGVFLLA